MCTVFGTSVADQLKGLLWCLWQDVASWYGENFQGENCVFSGWLLNQPIWKIGLSNGKSSPSFGMNIKNVWNHHLVFLGKINWLKFCFQTGGEMRRSLHPSTPHNTHHSKHSFVFMTLWLWKTHHFHWWWCKKVPCDGWGGPISLFVGGVGPIGVNHNYRGGRWILRAQFAIIQMAWQM